MDLPWDLPVQEAVERYEASLVVEYAEPDFVVQPARSPNDPYCTDNLYGLNNIGQTGGVIDADVDAPEAWDTSSGDPHTVAAVIDEGVDTSHSDLKGNIWVNADEVPDNGVDDDKNGYIDDVNGYDFANDDATVYDPDPLRKGKGDEHGTHVAGVAALIKSRRPGLEDAQLKAQILQYVDKQPSLESKTVTGGRLNLVRALTQDADATKPVVAPVRPKPDSRTQDRTPTIIATARDEPTGLTKNDLRHYLDGVARGAFSYNGGTDRLSYTSGKLSYARHTVKIVARGAAGNVAVQTWRFEVVR